MHISGEIYWRLKVLISALLSAVLCLNTSLKEKAPANYADRICTSS